MKKKMPPKPRNPEAQRLQSALFRRRKLESAKNYKRKPRIGSEVYEHRIAA